MGKRALFLSLLVPIVIAALALLFASQAPDGLEKVAGELRFLARSKELIGAVMPDHFFSRISSPFWRGFLTSTTGVVVVFLVTLVVAWLMRGAGRLISSDKR